MHLVPVGLDGEPIWRDKFHVNSLEEFAKTREAAMAKHGRHFGLVSNCLVEETVQGRTVMTYHLCAEHGQQFLFS
jgi:hypothetical protein